MNLTNHDVITIWIFQHASLLWSFTVTFQRSAFHVQAHECWRIRKVRGLIGAGKSRWTFVTLNVLLSFQTWTLHRCVGSLCGHSPCIWACFSLGWTQLAPFEDQTQDSTHSRQVLLFEAPSQVRGKLEESLRVVFV